MKKRIFIVLLVFYCGARAEKYIEEGSDEWFEQRLQAQYDCKKGQLCLRSAEGLLMLAATENPDQVLLLRERYAAYEEQLESAWQNVLFNLITEGYWAHAKRLSDSGVDHNTERMIDLFKTYPEVFDFLNCKW